MARARIRVYAADREGDAYSGAAVALYEGGTLTLNAAGAVTAGTAYQSSLYAAVSGGSPTTSFTTDANGMVEIFTDYPRRYDVRVAPSGVTAYKYTRETWEYDPLDILTTQKTGVYPLEAYGFGDGVTTDQAAVAAAVAAASNGGVIRAPENALIDVTGITWTSKIIFEGAGPSTVFRFNTSTDEARAFTASGSQSSSVALGSDAEEGHIQITLDAGGVSTLGLAVGDLISLSSGTWLRQYATVLGLPGGEVVTLSVPLYETFTTVAPTTVRKITPISDIGFRDCTLDGSLAAVTNGHGLWMVNVLRPRIERVHFKNFSGSGLLLFGFYGARMHDLTFERCGNDVYADCYWEIGTDLEWSGLRSDRATGFGPEFQRINGFRGVNTQSTGADDRGAKFLFASHGRITNIEVSRATKTGIGVTSGCHDLAFVNAEAFANTQEGYWFESTDGEVRDITFLGGSSKDNASYNLSLHTNTNKIRILDCDIDLSSLAKLSVSSGVQNIIRSPSFGQEAISIGAASDPTRTGSTAYATMNGDGASSELAVSMVTTGGSLQCALELNFSHDTIGGDVTIALTIDGGAEVKPVSKGTADADEPDILRTSHTFTGLTAGTHVVRGRWKISDAGHTVTAIGTARSLTVREGLVK